MSRFMGQCLGATVVAVAFALALAPDNARAQYYDDPGLGQEPVTIFPQDYKPLGIRAGSFMLHPGVQLAAEFTDNVFFTENNTVSDTVYHVRPYITAQSTWSRHSLNVSAAADFAFYGDYSSQNYEDYFFNIDGRVDVKNRNYFNYGGNYMILHEDRSTRDSVQGFDPTRYHTYGWNLGYTHFFNRLSLGADYAMQWLDYDDSVLPGGQIIDNQDRDRREDNWTLTAGYQFRTEMQAYVSYTGYRVEYDDTVDRGGYERSGPGYTLNGGVNFTITSKLNGDLYAAYHHRTYDDPTLPGIDGWALGAGLQWNPTYLTSVYARVDSGIEETVNEFSSGYFRTLYSLRVDHELTRSIQLNAFISYSNNDYTQIPGAPQDAREYDKIWRNGIGGTWFINRFIYLNASYAWENLKTNVPDDGYTVNRIWLVLGLER